MKKPTRKKGEVLYAILRFIGSDPNGRRWSEIRDFMVSKGFTTGQVSLTLSRPLDHRNAVLHEKGFCTKHSRTFGWRLNQRGVLKLKELNERFNPSVKTFSYDEKKKAFKEIPKHEKLPDMLSYDFNFAEGKAVMTETTLEAMNSVEMEDALTFWLYVQRRLKELGFIIAKDAGAQGVINKMVG